MNAIIVMAAKPCVHCSGLERYQSGGCVPCVKARSVVWKANNRDKTRAASRRYHAENPEKIRAAHRKRRCPEPSRPEPNVCEMCGSPPSGKALNLDHCHKRDVFRGWLCWGCNVALGKLGDSIDEAIARLRRYREVANVTD